MNNPSFRELKANIWDVPADGYAVTINLGYRLVDGVPLAIMGAGIAKQAADRYPGCREILGRNLSKGIHCTQVIYASRDPFILVYGFPTKHVYWENSSLELIKRSAYELMGYVETYEHKHLAITRPGCGLGRLDWDTQVKPALSQIFDSRIIVTS